MPRKAKGTYVYNSPKDHTDAHAVRFFYDNDRICDRARPDDTAGLHKHAVETNENRGIIVCVCCGLTRQERPGDAGQWYMVEVSV
jgi:hypothetical protein